MKKTIIVLLTIVAVLSGACSSVPSYQSCPVYEHTPVSNPYFQRLWSRPGISIYPDRFTPLMQGVASKVFVVTNQDFEYGGSKILAFDTHSGNVLWQRKVGFSASNITNSTHLFTTLYDKIEVVDPQTGNLVKEIGYSKVGSIYNIFATEHDLFAFTASGRHLTYNFDTETSTISEPFLPYYPYLIENGVMYFSEADMYKAQEMETQAILWEQLLNYNEFFKAHPLFTDNTIVLLTEMGKIYGLDKRTGNLLWRMDAHTISNVVAHKSKLYYLANDGYLKVLDLANGQEIAKVEFAPTPFQLVDPAAQNTLIGAYNLWVDSENDILTVSLGDSCQLMGFKINEP